MFSFPCRTISFLAGGKFLESRKCRQIETAISSTYYVHESSTICTMVQVKIGNIHRLSWAVCLGRPGPDGKKSGKKIKL